MPRWPGFPDAFSTQQGEGSDPPVAAPWPCTEPGCLVPSRDVHLGLQDLGSDPVFKHSKLLVASHRADCHNKGLTRILMSLAREKDAV